ncbi:MAG TPA: PAS domain S-box protein, partial [Ardenticatenaceae bacterium]|nr:PAS domain S-box protein [Ardenticatenaceae bacterium]
MNPAFQLLFDLFEQVGNSPDAPPQVPVECFTPGSDERRLLEAFGGMLERVSQSRQQLRERYEHLVNSIDGIVWEADANTVEFSFVSQQAERLLGYPTSRWVSEPTFWQEHIHPDDRDWAVPFCAIATSEMRPHEFEYRMIAADGRIVWLRDIVTVGVENRRPVRLQGIMVDVTEQKRVLERLEQLQRQHELILNAAGEGICGIDRHGHTIFLNPAATRLLGWEPEELLGQMQHEILHHSRPDGTPSPHLECPVYATLSEGRVRTVDDEVFWRKDGSSVPVEYTRTPSVEQGEIVGAVVTFRDITKRKEAEDRLREKEAQYRAVFEATADGLVLNDLETGAVVAVNPAYARMHGYSVEECENLPTTALIPPSHHHMFEQRLGTVRAGAEFRGEGYGVRKDGTLMPVEVHGTRVTYLGKPHMLGVVRDITERVQAYQLLEQRVEERTRELATLLEVSQNVASTLALKPLLNLILEQLRIVADYEDAGVTILEGDELVAAAYKGVLPEEQILGLRRPLERLGILWDRLQQQEPIVLGNVHGSEPMEQAFQVYAGANLHTTLVPFASCMLVPLVARNKVIGFLALYRREQNYYSEHHARLVLAIANQAAVAIENARLYERAQEEVRKTATLARIASSVALGGPLETALDEVAHQVVEATGAMACSMTIAQGEPPRLTVCGVYGLPEDLVAAVDAMLREGVSILTTINYTNPRPLVVSDMRERVLALPEYAPVHHIVEEAPWEVMLSLPMLYEERHLGRLNLYYPPNQEPEEDELAFLTAVANQAATAVENARLYSHAQALAALEERQRLARELHDSVSQALYGIGLGARTA